jgi:hypothetical protein
MSRDNNILLTITSSTLLICKVLYVNNYNLDNYGYLGQDLNYGCEAIFLSF